MGKIIRRVLTIIPVAALQVLWYLLLMKWLAPYAPVIASLLSAAAFFWCFSSSSSATRAPTSCSGCSSS